MFVIIVVEKTNPQMSYDYDKYFLICYRNTPVSVTSSSVDPNQCYIIVMNQFLTQQFIKLTFGRKMS